MKISKFVEENHELERIVQRVLVWLKFVEKGSNLLSY